MSVNDPDKNQRHKRRDGWKDQRLPMAIAVLFVLLALGIWGFNAIGAGHGSSAATPTATSSSSAPAGNADRSQGTESSAKGARPSMKVENALPDKPANDGSTVDFGTGKPVSGDSSTSYDFGDSAPVQTPSR